MFRSIDSASVFLRLPFFLQKRILSSSFHVKNMNSEIYKKFILKKFSSHQYIQNYDFILYDGICYINSPFFEDVTTNIFRDEMEQDNICLNGERLKLESVHVVDIHILRCINNGWGTLLEGDNEEIEIATFTQENVNMILETLEDYYEDYTITWMEEDIRGYHNYRIELVNDIVLNIILFQ